MTPSPRMKYISSALLFLTPSFAYAYIDPGSGAYYVQVAMALLGAVAFYLTHPKELIRRVTDLIKFFIAHFKK